MVVQSILHEAARLLVTYDHTHKYHKVLMKQKGLCSNFSANTNNLLTKELNRKDMNKPTSVKLDDLHLLLLMNRVLPISVLLS